MATRSFILQSIKGWQGVINISPCNIAGLISNVSEEVATQIAKNCRRRQPHCRLTPHAEEPPWISDAYFSYPSVIRKLESLGYTFLLLIIWVYLHSFSRCCLVKMRSSAKFRENLNLYQFKVIEGHRWLKIAYVIRRPRSLCCIWNFEVKLTVRKLVMGLLCCESCMILTSTVFDWSTRVTDRRTDGRAMA